MKYFKIYSALLLLLGLIVSCEEDLKVEVPADAVNPELSAPETGGTYILEKVNEENVFATFEWSDADFVIPVVEEYSIDVDIKGGDFSKNYVIASGISSPHEVTVGDFNKALLAAGFVDGEAHDIVLRVSANHHLATETIEMNVTTYFDAEPWTVIGSAVGGWDEANDQYMTYDKDNDVYTINLDMTPGEFKFRAPKKGDDAWAYNYGLTGDSEVIENAEGVELTQDGANVLTLGGNYTITLDVTNETFSIVQNSAGDLTNWTDVVLDAVGTGVSADNPDATADGSSWNWGNVLLPDNEGKPTASGSLFTWTWTGIILEADEGFKLRTLNGVAAPQNDISFDVGYGALDVENSSDKVVDKDGNFSVTEKGEYTITIEIDAANGDAKTVTIEEYTQYPEAVYLVGDATAYGWDTPGTKAEAVMHKIAGGDANLGVFWKIAYLEADKGFKISAADWESPNVGFGEVTEFDANGQTVSDNGGNMSITASGMYTIVIDLRGGTTKVSVTEVKVYGIGDAFGGWTEDVEANMFTVDNTAKTVTSPALTGNASIRSYVDHEWIPDWWNAEFVPNEGVIEYRNDGGDPSAIDGTTGQVVTYMFDDNTCSIN
ncbi:SusF/SusE family outer membrane protein [Carboxylicivirga linearis]|uniref:SusF/SusE family outer membrane protein n=1 Tax=Carboxylicivirga linearis TaxID=1628157 RepID=A0ABS5JVS3_9BACT|nr:SusF/SusE family outer membrane protein [Carboxylicivirga linearis]MBS2098944.1 SusF/SusE family outer membrane protein [Carboxylicivirga linearis]